MTLYLVLVIIGWLNIYSTNYDETANQTIFSLSINSGRQFIYICVSLLAFIIIMMTDFRIYDSLAYYFYFFFILLLLIVIIFGREVAGSRSWLELGPFRFQPSEFAKFATALAIGKYMTMPGFSFNKPFKVSILGAIIVAPVLFIILQGDTGTALVFAALVVPLFREGLNPTILILGIAAVAIFILTLFVEKLYLAAAIIGICLLIIIAGKKTFKRIAITVVSGVFVFSIIFGVDYFVTEVLQPHQQNRIKALINPDSDPLGYGWNVTQSKIAIGSGGFNGKGYLQGTQTKYDFVPEQTTDFIFCTIGEEGGWVGSFIVIVLFIILMMRLVNIAERQKSKFARIYGYAVVGLLFFHFTINIGMTIGFFPVIGIPLPFFSYGGSSLLAFSILLFILLKLDAHRMQILVR